MQENHTLPLIDMFMKIGKQDCIQMQKKSYLKKSSSTSFQKPKGHF